MEWKKFLQKIKLCKIFIPYENGSDLEELPKEILEYIKIVKVKNYSEIFKALF